MNGRDDHPALWTVTRIASRLGIPRHRVEYVIETRGITPIGSAGAARVYDSADVDRIGHEIRLIEGERPAGEGVQG